MANFELKVLSLALCQFLIRKIISEKQRVSGYKSQAYKIWRKNVYALPSNGSLLVLSHFLAAPCLLEQGLPDIVGLAHH